VQRDACKRLLREEDSGRRVGDGYDRLPACQLIVLVLLNLAWGPRYSANRKAESPSPSWPAERSKALAISNPRSQRRHVVDSSSFIWHTASLMLVVAVTSSHLPTRIACQSAAHDASCEEGAARLQRVETSQHLATSLVPLEPDDSSLYPKTRVATTCC
jgi:hypothetical protein